jgi:MerR family mercuric resistance operon transcriptional regulator
MAEMTIAKLARAVGVGVETVRYYQRRGLMPTPRAVGDSAYRHYDAGHLARLRFIRRAQAAGFTLEEIRELLDADGGADRTRVRALAEARLAALAAQQQELERSRRALEGLFEACSQAPSGPCPIIAAFETPAG